MQHLSGDWILLCMSLCEKLVWQQLTSVRLKQLISRKVENQHKVPAGPQLLHYCDLAFLRP